MLSLMTCNHIIAVKVSIIRLMKLIKTAVVLTGGVINPLHWTRAIIVKVQKYILSAHVIHAKYMNGIKSGYT